MSAAEREVWETVQAMNRAWTRDGQPERLREFFHADIVVLDPVKRERTEGREAAVAGWTAFAAAARTERFDEIDPRVQLYGDGRFAVVTYYYDMTYCMGEQRVDTGGRDMFVLVHEDGRWQIVADHFSVYPGDTQA